MPKYDFKCPNCQTIENDVILPMNHTPIECPSCNQKMKKHFTRSSIPQIATVKIEPFFDIGLGRYVKDSEITEICKREDKTFASDTELDQECDKNRLRNEQKLDTEIRQGIRQIAKQVHEKG